ncbi:MAG: hypothetical protein Q8Q94_03115 [bacterium]|nr:hypothetical protein [bacterium]MDZ4299403.1 hypothetical protein [Candidatus Sungbacteria bacterium]
MRTPILVTNFAYGTGPYLRTTDLAVALNNELEKSGRERCRILVPWVYGDRQKTVMLEEFAAHNEKYPNEILLDSALGGLLHSIFYTGTRSYEDALWQWVATYRDVSQAAHDYLSGTLKVETLHGERIKLSGKDIIAELSRSPRIRYDIAPSYFTSFAYVGEILERAQEEEGIAVDRALLQKGAEAAHWVESNHRFHCIAWPATFAYLGDERHQRYPTEIIVPPIAPPPIANDEELEPGIFVTITGIPGLERLYADAARLGLKLYSNNTDVVSGSVHLSPHVIPNKNISFQFARAGWSSIWLSMISGTPLVVPDFDLHDDPEIFFNNRSVEKLGLGMIYRGESLEEILKRSDDLKKSMARMKDEVLHRFGTFDGNRACAELFAKDF